MRKNEFLGSSKEEIPPNEFVQSTREEMPFDEPPFAPVNKVEAKVEAEFETYFKEEIDQGKKIQDEFEDFSISEPVDLLEEAVNQFFGLDAAIQRYKDEIAQGRSPETAFQNSGLHEVIMAL